jgi:DNA-binding winged helix-turn-helix (wHTH) protein
MQVVRFGPFRLDGKTRTLTRSGTAVALGGRALDVLIALAGADGAPLSKGVLLDRVWPGVTVGENNLQVQVSLLRRALGDGWIVTVPGHGYRHDPRSRQQGQPVIYRLD